MNEVTAKKRSDRKNIGVSVNSHNALNAYVKGKDLTMAQVVESLIEWLPVYESCVKQELSIDAAIQKLTASHIVKVWEKSDKPVSSKTMDKFSDWLEKLYRHNEKSDNADRVFITQRLLLNLTNGNGNMISAAFKEKNDEVMAHNKRMGLDESTNRKLSHRIRDEYGTVADWLTKILA